MIKKFHSLGFTLLLLSISHSAVAHPGMMPSSNLHLFLHAMLIISIVLSIVAIGFFVFRRNRKTSQQRVKK